MDTLVVAVRVVVSLAVVLGVLWYLHRRISRGRVRGAGDSLSIVGRQAVGQKSSVVIVSMDGRRFLLGVTEQGISMLHSEAPAQVPAQDGEPAATAVEIPDAVSPGAPDAQFALAMAEAAPAAPVARTIPRHAAESTATHPSRRDVHRTDQRRRAEQGLADVVALDPHRRQPQPAGMLGNSILAPSTWRQAAVALRRAR